MFTSITTPCQSCKKSGILSCVKRWGPLKESAEKEATNIRANDLPGKAQVVRSFVFEPSRQLPTAIDAVIRGEEVNMLQYIYTEISNTPWLWAGAMFQVITQIRFNYGLSVECQSIRSALLFVAAARMLHQGVYQNDEQFDKYSIRANRALWRKDCSLFDVEEFFCIYFLIIAEDLRLWAYVNSDRPREDLDRAYMQGCVHVRGMLALMNKLDERLRSTVVEKFGEATWTNIQDHLAAALSASDGEELVKMASLYRREFQNKYVRPTKTTLGLQCASSQRIGAVGNVMAGLSKMILKGLVRQDEHGVGRSYARHELKMYLHYSENTAMSNSLSLRDQQYWIMQQTTAKILLHLSEEPSKRTLDTHCFVWAKHLTSAALRLHGLSTGPRFRVEDENEAIMDVCMSALMIPPADDFNCKYSISSS